MSARAPRRASVASGHRLRVNPIACDAHGMCAELLPEQHRARRVGISGARREALPASLLALARHAVEACPTRALLLERRVG